MYWYLEVLKKYAVFGGRARRTEYWMFFLFNLFITGVLGLVEGFLGIPGVLGIPYGLVVLIPSIAVTTRRLHDTDRTSWWLLISLLPPIGVVFLFIFMVMDSTPGQNRYGANPKVTAGQDSLADE